MLQVILRAEPQAPPARIKWADGIVDNEHLGRKKSKSKRVTAAVCFSHTPMTFFSLAQNAASITSRGASTSLPPTRAATTHTIATHTDTHTAVMMTTARAKAAQPTPSKAESIDVVFFIGVASGGCAYEWGSVISGMCVRARAN